MRRLLFTLMVVLALVGTTASCTQGGNDQKPGATAVPRY